MHPLPATAVLIFVRNEREEAQLKSFHRSGRTRLQVIRTFNQRITQVTRQSGLPFFVIKGQQQVGADFGERFANAIETVFAAGFANVIAVGNDCLSLNAKQLQRVAQLLEANTPVVLGPAKDGGVYTIGINRSAYHRAHFLQLPWQTAWLLTSFLQYAQRLQADCFCLAPANDADDEVSLQCALADIKFYSRLYHVLINILQQARPQLQQDIPVLSKSFTQLALLRAPPAAG